ncbi:MAG: DUF4440 domain-containing protein [Thermoanaerobaculia bacterium]|nr:DUF4440 domain-containing protein [Thermoanaerobaculia bacterium]
MYRSFVILVSLLVAMILGLSVDVAGDTGFRPEQVREVIKSNNERFSEGFRSGDARIIASNYAKDAILMQPGKDFRVGRDSILEFWRGSMSVITDMKLTVHSLNGTRDVIYETGIVDTWVRSDAGGLVVVRDKYVNVWRLQNDGQYKIAVDIWNRRPNPEE